jgi:hypothetical protein
MIQNPDAKNDEGIYTLHIASTAIAPLSHQSSNEDSSIVGQAMVDQYSVGLICWAPKILAVLIWHQNNWRPKILVAAF